MLITEIKEKRTEKIRIRENVSQLILTCGLPNVHLDGSTQEVFGKNSKPKQVEFEALAFNNVYVTAYVERSGKNIEILKDVPLNVLDKFSRDINELAHLIQNQNTMCRVIDLFGEGYLKLNTGEDLIIELTGLYPSANYVYKLHYMTEFEDSKELVRIDKKQILSGEKQRSFDVAGYERLFIPTLLKNYIEEIELIDRENGNVLKIDRETLSFYSIFSSDKMHIVDEFDYSIKYGEIIPIFGFEELRFKINEGYSTTRVDLDFYLQTYVLNDVAVIEEKKEEVINQQLQNTLGGFKPIKTPVKGGVMTGKTNFVNFFNLK